MDRPEFNRALERIRDGVSGGIIVARMDRFSRTLTGALATIQEIDAAGGVLIECDGDWDTSNPMGRFGRDLVLRLAHLYREQTAENWNVARERAVARGLHITSAPAGYRKRDDGLLEPWEPYATAVRVAFEMRAQGQSQAQIARHLIREGVPTRKTSKVVASSWSIRAVQQLLKNRAYLGEARSGQYVNADAHEPLVGRGLFKAVQDMRGEVRAASIGDREGPLLGGGMLRCAGCGCRLAADYTVARGKRYAFYRCKSNLACTEKVSISAAKIEPYLEGIVRRFLSAHVYEPEVVADSALGGLRAALADAAAYQAELDEAVAGGTRVAVTTLAAAAGAVEVAQQALDVALAQVEAPVEYPTSGEAWDALSIPERRRIMQALLGRVVVRRGKNLSVEERISRPDAPDDFVPDEVPVLDERALEAFASALRERKQAAAA